MNKFKGLYKKYKDLPLSAKAAFWFMVCSIIQKGLTMITTPIFTRMLSTNEYGQYTVYVSWFQIFTIITTLRLDYSIFNKGMTKFKSNKSEYTVTMQTTTSIITILVFLIYIPFNDYVNSLIELPFFLVTMIFVECFFAPAMNFWLVEQRYDFRYVRVVFVTLLLSLLNVILGLLFVYFSSEKGYARILSCIISQIIVSIFIYIANVVRGKKLFNKVYAKYALKFNIPLVPHYISIYILDQADRVMIQKLCSTAEAGLFGVAVGIGGIFKIVTTALNTTLIPVFYRKLEKNDVQSLRKIILIVSYVLVCMLLFLELVAPELMVIYAGEQYRIAAYVIPPISASVLLTFLYQLIANIEFYYNANKFTMVISVFGAILNLILNFIFINIFGFIAAAYTTAFCYLLFVIAHYYYMRKCLRKNNISDIFNGGDIWRLLVVLVVSTIIISLLYKWLILRLVFIILLIMILGIKRRSIISLLEMFKKY